VHYDSRPLGHSKLDTTARYAHVASGFHSWTIDEADRPNLETRRNAAVVIERRDDRKKGMCDER
jgi:hypothetical protein